MRLTDIKEYLNTLLASFSSVLNLELTILQTDPLERVAATGSWYTKDVVCYEHGRLVPAWQNSYTVRVIETGKPVVALDTKAYVYSHPKMYQTVEGQYYSVLAYPIYLRDHLEGVLVIASLIRLSTRSLWKNRNSSWSTWKKSQVLSPVSWNRKLFWRRPISSTTR